MTIKILGSKNNGTLWITRHKPALMKLVFAFTLITSLLGHTDANACESGGWPVAKDTAPVSSDFVAETSALQKKHGIKISKSNVQVRCPNPETYYDIKDEKGRMLIRLPVPHKDGAPNPFMLVSRVRHLMKTPKAELLMLNQAREQFWKDADAVYADHGIRFHAPGGPIEERTVGGKAFRLNLTSEWCGPEFYTSNSSISANLTVDTMEYSPSRTRYSQTEVYREGQLRARLIKDQAVLSKMADRARHNATNCEAKIARQDWSQIVPRLEALAGPGTTIDLRSTSTGK
jgi:hypothetical protein